MKFNKLNKVFELGDKFSEDLYALLPLAIDP